MVVDELLNVTIGSFQLQDMDLIYLDENGEYRASIEALQKILDILSMFGKLKIKVAKDGTIGQMIDGEYTTGILGMMERGEIEICLFPLSIDIPSPPGRFSSVITDEPFTISSFHSNTERHIQDVTSSLISIDWSTRITIITLIFMLETFNILVGLIQNSKRSSDQLFTSVTLYKAIERVPNTLFGQYFPDRSLIRFSVILGLFLFTIILNSTLSTDTILGQKEKLPETLSDIVKLNFTPRFFEGESMIELFEQGITKDYRSVYTLAKQRQANSPIGLGTHEALMSAAPGNALLSSVRTARAGLLMSIAIGNPYAKFAHLSVPYHQSLQAFLMNPRNKTNSYIKKIDLSIKSIYESGISPMLLSKTFDQVIVAIGLGINEFMIIRYDMRKMEKRINFSFKPLSLAGFQGIFRVWQYSIVVIIVTEIILTLVHSLHRRGKRSISRSY